MKIFARASSRDLGYDIKNVAWDVFNTDSPEEKQEFQDYIDDNLINGNLIELYQGDY